MKYRWSSYVYCFQSGSDLILFNSLNGKMIILRGMCLIEDNALLNQIISNKEIKDALYEELFIVSHENEEKYVIGKCLDTIEEPWLRITILPTLQCNFRCKYCYENHCGQRLEKKLIDGLIRFISMQAVGKKGISIEWFGGEPLLEIENIEYFSGKMIRYCKEHKIIYKASMTTNGYLLSLNVFERLRKCKINQFQITIDGTEKIHNSNRHLANGNGTYFQIVQNLLMIKDNITSGSFKITIRTNITNEMLCDLAEIVKNLELNFGNDGRFNFLFRPVGDWGGESVKKIKGSLISDTNEMYSILMNTTKKLDLSPHYYGLHNGMCEAGYRNSFVILPDGKICKCTMALEDEKNIIGMIYEKKYWIDEKRIYEWIVPTKEQVRNCMECKMFAACFGLNCPYANFKKCTCGHEFGNMENVLNLFVNSDIDYNWIKEF